MPSSDFRFTSRLVVGLAVIAMGVLFTLDNLGVAQAGELLKWWPVLLIAYGVTRLLGFGARQSWFVGLTLTFAGVWTLFHHLGLVRGDIWQLWPLVFVFMGIGIIRRGTWGPRVYGIHIPGRRGRRWRRAVYGVDEDTNLGGAWGVGPEGGAPPPAPGTGSSGSAGAAAAGGADPAGGVASGAAGASSGAGSTGPDDGGWAGAWAGSRRWSEADSDKHFSVDVFMSSIARKVTAQQFKRGEIVAIMGGGDVDFRSARMESGVAQLEINLVMGGLNLFVPDDWAVDFQGTPVLGGVEDHSRRPSGDPKSRLIITGLALMSSVVIKN
jgi:hypothetical protein